MVVLFSITEADDLIERQAVRSGKNGPLSRKLTFRQIVDTAFVRNECVIPVYACGGDRHFEGGLRFLLQFLEHE